MLKINERSAFIEETGLLFENFGMTRMAGRILGYLMVTDKEMVSFDELTHVLQASKSSISTNVKALTFTHFIKPITTPGDRKTYYMLSPDVSWVEMYRTRMQQLDLMVKVFEKGLGLRTNSKDKSSQWLQNGIDFYSWVLKEFPHVLDKWEEHVKNKTA